MIPAILISFFVGLLFLAGVALIVWLIVMRVREKQKETFEKRDN